MSLLKLSRLRKVPWHLSVLADMMLWVSTQREFTPFSHIILSPFSFLVSCFLFCPRWKDSSLYNCGNTLLQLTDLPWISSYPCMNMLSFINFVPLADFFFFYPFFFFFFSMSLWASSEVFLSVLKGGCPQMKAVFKLRPTCSSLAGEKPPPALCLRNNPAWDPLAHVMMPPVQPGIHYPFWDL